MDRIFRRKKLAQVPPWNAAQTLSRVWIIFRALRTLEVWRQSGSTSYFPRWFWIASSFGADFLRKSWKSAPKPEGSACRSLPEVNPSRNRCVSILLGNERRRITKHVRVQNLRTKKFEKCETTLHQLVYTRCSGWEISFDRENHLKFFFKVIHVSDFILLFFFGTQITLYWYIALCEIKNRNNRLIMDFIKNWCRNGKFVNWIKINKKCRFENSLRSFTV